MHHSPASIQLPRRLTGEFNEDVRLAFPHLSDIYKSVTVSIFCESEVAQLCPTLCDPMDCSLPGSSVHGIFQARILEWVAISFSRGIFLTQRWNPILLHWQVDSLPLSHQGGSNNHIRRCDRGKAGTRRFTVAGIIPPNIKLAGLLVLD